MPRIDLIPVPEYGGLDPYHFYFDNLPFKNLMRRQDLINLALDNVIEQNTDAIGTQGTFANRLNQSINADGSLKTTAIDEALHSIEEHTDSVNYVRMTAAQSAKLDLITDEANSFGVQIEINDSGDTVNFSTGNLEFIRSSTVNWEIVDSNKVAAHMTFPVAAAHSHYYDQVPVPQNSLDPDLKNYKINTIASPYIAGSLRIFINGMRLSSSVDIYIAGALVTDPWTLISYTEDASNGLFTLSAAISEEDVIRIDYDLSYI